MERRDFFRRAGIGSAALTSASALFYKLRTTVQAGENEGPGGHDHGAIEGSLANATVSFGQWQTGPQPLDRFPNNSPIDRNQHQLIPNIARIKAGGSVNFVIGGFHHVLIYDHGTQPEDINAALANPAFALLIDDPRNRIYRGLDPRVVPQDRVEVVNLAKPGLYLVICGVRPHFADGMFGFVKVLARDAKEDDD